MTTALFVIEFSLQHERSWDIVANLAIVLAFEWLAGSRYGHLSHLSEELGIAFAVRKNRYRACK